MAVVLEDPNEVRNRRMKTLLDTAMQAQQIQNQRQEMVQKQQQAIAESQLGYAKLGYRPINQKLATSPGGRLPSQMTTGAYGQSYVPSKQMQNMVPQYVFDPNTGQFMQTGVAPKGSQIRSKAISPETYGERSTATTKARQEAEMENIPEKQKVELANRKYDTTEVKALSQAEAIVTKIGRIKEMVGTGSETLSYAPFGLGNTGGQLFKSLTDDVKNTLLYLRSGAQINEQEYKRLSSQLPKLFRKGEVDKDQLTRFEDEFNGVLNRIKFGAQAEKINSGKAGAEDLAKLGFNLPSGFKLNKFAPKEKE